MIANHMKAIKYANIIGVRDLCKIQQNVRHYESLYDLSVDLTHFQSITKEEAIERLKKGIQGGMEALATLGCEL